MNERYRWNEEQERRRARERTLRGRDQARRGDLGGADDYGAPGREPGYGAYRSDENRSWQGREPYRKDLGGLNHPGDAHSGRGLDPLTGDRGSAEQDRSGGGRHRGYGYGDEAVRQRGGGYTAGQAAGGYAGASRYAEGGFETRAHDRYDHEREHEARSWWRKARDEFRAWMGDREAERRVRMDHEESERHGRHGGDWRGHDDDTGWRDPLSDADQNPRRAGPGDDHRYGGGPREHRPGFFRDEDNGRW